MNQERPQEDIPGKEGIEVLQREDEGTDADQEELDVTDDDEDDDLEDDAEG